MNMLNSSIGLCPLRKDVDRKDPLPADISEARATIETWQLPSISSILCGKTEPASVHTNVAPLMCNLLTSTQSLQVTVGRSLLFIHVILYCKIWGNGCLQFCTLLSVICTLNAWIRPTLLLLH